MSRIEKFIYEDNIQKIKYSIELSINVDEVVFNVKENNILKDEFEASFSLASLFLKNPIFKLCNKIEDCLKYF